MRKLLKKIIWFLLGRCPKCGNKVYDYYGYGDSKCSNEDCDWISP